MTFAEHEIYAREILSSLPDNHPQIENLMYTPDPTQSRNAAKAMTAILCHRLIEKSGYQPRPTRKGKTTYEWKEGIFNCRNIADRDYLWTNMRRRVADVMHAVARNKPVVYLLAFSNPSDTTLNVWTIPEPLLHDSLSSLPSKESGQEYTLQIFTNKQRIEKCAASPDLTPYFRAFPLSKQELLVLKDARGIDASVRSERVLARGKQLIENNEDEGSLAPKFATSRFLARAAQQLTEEGAFNPSGIADARDRVLSSIVRRRGQPAFRQHLLAAYEGRCAITGCNLEPVLEAAHIIPYRGPHTNHPCNGLLLRTDLHTLFDLKLVAIDVSTMSLLISPSLAGTCYEEYRGRPISLPNEPRSQPSRAALEQHRKESGLRSRYSGANGKTKGMGADSQSLGCFPSPSS
jgi:hypothetical protein